MKNNYIDLKRTESTPTEPCTLAEAKAQCIVTYTDDDTLITSLITKARKAIENYCNISIVSQTVVMTADLYNEWELPYGPVTAINSVTTRSGNEGSGPMTYETLTSGWGYDGEEFKTFIPGSSNFTTPFIGNIDTSLNYRYKVTYTTGYGTVPDDLKQAVLLQIAWLYEHRGDEVKDYSFVPGVCDDALKFADPYKRQLWV